MKKFFSVFTLALVLAIGTITVFANTGTATSYDEATTEAFSGSISWNGEAWELEISVNDISMLLTFDNLVSAYANEYPVDLEMLLQLIGDGLPIQLMPVTTPTLSVTTPATIDPQQQTDIVFWVRNGSVYHSTENCTSLSRSTNIQSGLRVESGMPRGCRNCT
ncbi:MAG: hypothetical protein FWC91_03335 [Defluviitaleaceae bacterium]|nr:hypothetical protein [Defluviitaleaceae bacterium]